MPSEDLDINGPKSPSYKLRSSFTREPNKTHEIDMKQFDAIVDCDPEAKNILQGFALYKYYLDFVIQDTTYTSHVQQLSSHATFFDQIKWYIAYPFRREKPVINYFWMAVPTFLTCLILHGWATRLAFLMHKGGPRLADSGFWLLPELDPAYKVLSEVFFNTIFIGTIVVVLLHPQRFRILTRALFMYAFLYLCRSASFLSTSLPSPASHCDITSPYYDPPKTTVDIFFKFSLTAGCGDLIFSGHTLHSTTAVLIFMKYCSSKLARVLMGCGLFTTYLLIIAARKHYTIDVLVAAYFVPFVFMVYTDRVEPWLYRNVKKRKSKEEREETKLMISPTKEAYAFV